MRRTAASLELKVGIVATSDNEQGQSTKRAKGTPAWAGALFDLIAALDDRLGGIEKAIKGVKARVSDLESRHRTTQLASRFVVAPFVDDLVQDDASLREQPHRKTPSSPSAQ
jgi:hypothetical protein